VITVAICFLFLRQLVRVTEIRGSLLIPFILMLIAVGAFAEKNVFEDVLIVLLFGALGWIMSRLGWPRPPLLLGLVLGPLAENRLFLSTDNYGLAWLARPGVLVLLAIIVIGLVVPIVSARRRAASAAAPLEASAAPAGERWRLDGVTAFTAVVVILFAWSLWESRGFGPRAGLFPWVVCGAGLVLALAQLARDLIARRDPPSGEAGVAEDIGVPADVARWRTREICLWIVGFWVALWLLGFSFATLIMTFLYLRISAREGWLLSSVLAACAFAFVYGLFERALVVPFPTGLLLAWLGLA
ncbi:MAG TPA: tripartite tricarboxylate transporter permease, partial [Methylomirabilota bacterium]|nr:tripartite tricarboxylate transporter permease [Methylomirabilota bacterium]